MGYFTCEYGHWNIQYHEGDVWVTRSGQEIKIRDMTDLHLINTIYYVERTKQTLIPEYQTMVKEAIRRRLIDT